MQIRYPAYYDTFSCIAAACPDSCCKEWTVDVDANAADCYRHLEGALGDRLRAVLTDTEDGAVMEIENGRCPMWRQDGLCRIQAELGHDALCKTCREFPRLRHDYGDFAELDLEMSCPEAARLILNGDACWRTVEKADGAGEPDYESQVMSLLLRSRREAMNFVEAGAYAMPQTLAILLIYAHGVQSALDGGEMEAFVPEECLQLAKKYAKTGDWEAVRAFFEGLEILTDAWRDRLAGPEQRPQWTREHRRFLQYLLRRYWLQAVSDYDLICRVKLAVTACLLTACLGGDFERTAQLFSKEIENDPDNVEAILDGAYTSPALTDLNLLSLLLAENEA